MFCTASEIGMTCAYLHVCTGLCVYLISFVCTCIILWNSFVLWVYAHTYVITLCVVNRNVCVCSMSLYIL